MRKHARRVVVTGIGAVSPIGLTATETWKNACNGVSGIGKISHFDAAACSVHIAAEVKNFEITRPFGPFTPDPAHPEAKVTMASTPKDTRRLGRFIQLALVAGLEAYADSGLDTARGKIPAPRIGTNIGVGMGGLPDIEETHKDLLEKGYRRISPFFIPQVITNLASGQLSILLNLQGPNLCITTACASSAHSLGESFRSIIFDEADVMVAGGSEAVICPLGIGGFAAMKALSTRNDAPEKACRPFDVGRDGFIMGEGAAVLVLEELEHAKKRGAKIYGELCGYGLSGDAYHMTTPSPSGEGGLRAMKQAVLQARIRPEEIGYVNAHATSTPAGDAEETRAIAALFEGRTEGLNISATNKNKTATAPT